MTTQGNQETEKSTRTPHVHTSAGEAALPAESSKPEEKESLWGASFDDLVIEHSLPPVDVHILPDGASPSSRGPGHLLTDLQCEV